MILTNKQLIKGNYGIAEASVKAGCECYFGYPITPQTEIGEYLSQRMYDLKRGYVCAESELAAINMVIGAVSTGAKAMTSSSSCAVALMQEGLSYACSDELPVVLVNVMRAGPGLGYIYPAQGDYFQAVYGGGNGDYKLTVLAPSTVQECIDLTYRAFYLAQKWRNPTMVLADGLLGWSRLHLENILILKLTILLGLLQVLKAERTGKYILVQEMKICKMNIYVICLKNMKE